MIDVSKQGKGALVKEVTLRDYRLEAVPTAPQIPIKYEVPFLCKIKAQDGSGSCVSQAVAYYAEVLNYLETKEWVSMSPKFLYSKCFVEPMGSYIKDNMAMVKNEGVAPESLCSSYENGNPPSEKFMRRIEDVTPFAKEKALDYVSRSYFTWDNINIDLYKQAVLSGNGCIVASWGNDVLWTTNSGWVGLPDVPSQMTWRHGIYLIGYDDDKECFKFVNSWGEEWGDKGFGYLPYEYIERGFVSNPYTMIDMPNSYYSLLKKLVGLYYNLISLLK
jgi:hypothetical protein